MKKSELKKIIRECINEVVLNEGDNQTAYDYIATGLVNLDEGIDLLEDRAVANKIDALRERIGKIVRKLPGYR